jgi:hypothetical protein
MIFAVVAFTLYDAPLLTLRSQRTFPNMAECEAFLVREEPGYMMAAHQMSERMSAPVVPVAWCVAPGMDA